MEKIISTKTPAASAPITASASHNNKQKIISTNNMDKRTLLKKSKSQLINLLLKQNSEIKKQKVEIKKLLQQNMKPQPEIDNIIPPPSEFKDDHKPIPTPRKSVKQMVQDYDITRNPSHIASQISHVNQIELKKWLPDGKKKCMGSKIKSQFLPV